jgi:hypothetical protein
VEHRRRLQVVEHRLHGVVVADVQLVELGPGRHPVPASAGQVVDHGNAPAALEQRVRDV